MKVFSVGDFVSIDGETFLKVIEYCKDTFEFKYRDENDKLIKSHVWEVKEIKRREP